MKISQTGINLIKQFEGCQLKAYRCPANVWTIGWGHTGNVDGKPVGEGMTITQAKAEELLKQSLNSRYEPSVRKFDWLNQNQYDALVSFCYNLGPYIFKGNLLNAINSKDSQRIASQLLLYDKAGGKVLAGLTRRRKAEAELFLKSYEEGKTMEVQQIEIILNGKKKMVAAVNIDGTNHIKLRDLADDKIFVGYNECPIVQVIG